MYGKILSIPDSLIYRYFELASDEEQITLPELRKLCVESPRDAKHRLALSITRFYHGIEASEKAREHFERTVIRKEVPEAVASFKPDGDGQNWASKPFDLVWLNPIQRCGSQTCAAGSCEYRRTASYR